MAQESGSRGTTRMEEDMCTFTPILRYDKDAREFARTSTKALASRGERTKNPIHPFEIQTMEREVKKEKQTFCVPPNWLSDKYLVRYFSRRNSRQIPSWKRRVSAREKCCGKL